MPKKSRRRKPEIKRSPAAPAGKIVPVAAPTHKPWQIAAVCVLLAAITFIAFQGVRNNDFVTYDDHSYVVDNPHVQRGVNMQSIAWAFTTFDVSNWHPLTWISHMVDWSLYGRNAGGQHMTSLCLHAANSIMLFLLLFYATGFLGRSAIVAFLFALHPAHVEAVAWIAERKEVLCAFFWFVTLLLYLWYARKPSWKRYISVAFFFACALMSKPMAVTLPLTLLLLDYWPLHRVTFKAESRAHWFSSLWKLCLEKWLFFIMTAISCVITFIAQRAGHSVAELQLLPLWERLCKVAISYCRYLHIAFWPNPLTVYYYYDVTRARIFAAIISAIALILITVVCWKIRGKRPYCLAGWLWFLITMLPVIGIVQVGEQVMAERYTYVPFIGLFVAVVWLVSDAVAHSPKLKVAAQVLAVVVIAVCAAKSFAQVKVWKNTETLFTHALEVDPRGAAPNYSLGMVYETQGKYALAQEYVDRALSYNSTKPLILSYSAYCMMMNDIRTHDFHNLPLAGQRLEDALRLAPGDTNVLLNMALWSALMNKPLDEETYSREVLAAFPSSIGARLYLADSLLAQGKLDESAQEYRQALAIEPDLYEARNNLGNVLLRQGLNQEALKEFRLSLAIKPDQANPHSSIGRIFTEAHRIPEAVEEFKQALRFDPGSPNAHNDLGVALYQLGDYESAADQFSEAVRIDPSYADARKNLALVQARMKIKTAVNARR